MPALIIVGCLLLFLVLLFTVRFSIVLDMERTMNLTVRFLFLKFKILPTKAKKKKYNLRKYTLKKIRRREKIAAKKAARAAAKRQRKRGDKAWESVLLATMTPDERLAYKRAKKATRPALPDLIPLVLRVLKLFCSRFFGKVHMKVARLEVRVGSSDAMKTAVLYGVVNQSTQYLMEGLKRFTHVDGLHKAELSIAPDFLSNKIEYNFKLSIRLCLGNILVAVLRAGWKFLFGYMDIKPDTKEADKIMADLEQKAKARKKKQIAAQKQRKRQLAASKTPMLPEPRA